MRDSVLLAIVIAAFITVMLWKPAAAPSEILTQGATHETHTGTDPRSQSAARKSIQQSHRQDPEAAIERTRGESEGTASEGEKISSIYSHKKLKRSKKSKTVVHGVPLEDFVDAKQNALPMFDVTAGKPNGVRMFVQCMEVKKGNTVNLNERECSELALKAPSRRPRF